MHSSLTDLLENLKSGLLWVQGDGVVRYANGDGTALTGLAAGRKLYDPDLTRAIAAAVSGRVPRLVSALGTVPGAASTELQCRVIPGLAWDDAFVLIAPEAGLDAGSAYDNLMQVIRTDLRDPLREAHAALEMVRQSGDGHEVDAVTDGVAELVRVLDRLVDLADIWGSGALRASDRIELWPMLQSVWADVEPMAVSRSVKVRFRAQGDVTSLATMYGSEAWMRRVFLECLESAVRSERAGGTIEIEHRQLGPRAEIVFRDCPVFAAGLAPDIEPRGAASRGRPLPRGSARDQIGLKLCRHIVALHGGQLREEAEDGQSHFVIDLPTGAPHRSEQAQLGIAQAQRYASDLAALMARSRHRGGDVH